MTGPMRASYQISSPPVTGSGAAIAIIELIGEPGAVDGLLTGLGIAPVALGRTGLREAPGIDTMVVARRAADHAMLFPHAGPAVLKRLIAAMEAAGTQRIQHHLKSWPEVTDDLESHLNDALARAASPLAIDLLLEQPRRWREASDDPGRTHGPETCRALNRLIDPPLVVALGPPNIGKSSLLNALAGRTVSVVADQPGTTRDHVGVLIDLAGLVVRFVDAPGISDPACNDRSEAEIQREAQSHALALARQADLLLLCADACSEFIVPEWPPNDQLRLALRSDLGLPAAPFDCAVSVMAAESVPPLVDALRERLVPTPLRNQQLAWRFW